MTCDKPDGYVYFMRLLDDSALYCASGAFIKIGYAKDPLRRQRELETGLPHDLELMGMFAGKITDEAELHRRFAKHHVRREWFHDCDEVRGFVDDLVYASLLIQREKGTDYHPDLRECMDFEFPEEPIVLGEITPPVHPHHQRGDEECGSQKMTFASWLE